MTIKMPHAVKPANSEAEGRGVHLRSRRRDARPDRRARGRENGRQYAIRRGAFETDRPRRERSGHHPHRLAACGRVQGARSFVGSLAGFGDVGAPPTRNARKPAEESAGSHNGYTHAPSCRISDTGGFCVARLISLRFWRSPENTKPAERRAGVPANRGRNRQSGESQSSRKLIFQHKPFILRER